MKALIRNTITFIHVTLSNISYASMGRYIDPEMMANHDAHTFFCHKP